MRLQPPVLRDGQKPPPTVCRAQRTVLTKIGLFATVWALRFSRRNGSSIGNYLSSKRPGARKHKPHTAPKHSRTAASPRQQTLPYDESREMPVCPKQYDRTRVTSRRVAHGLPKEARPSSSGRKEERQAQPGTKRLRKHMRTRERQAEAGTIDKRLFRQTQKALAPTKWTAPGDNEEERHGARRERRRLTHRELYARNTSVGALRKMRLYR